MLNRVLLLATFFSAAVPALAAKPQTPVVLEPSSPWLLDYAEDYCRLARQFGGPGHETIFYIEQYEPSDRFSVLVAGPDFESQKLTKPALRFGPDGGTSSYEGVSGASMPKYGSGLLTSMTLLPDPDEGLTASERVRRWNRAAPDGEIKSPLDPAAAERIVGVEVLEKNRVLGRLALGSMREPVKALNACTDELLSHWGIDVAKHRTRSRAVAPKRNPATWIGPNDYPTDLLRKGEQGIVQFRLAVDESGRPTACKVQQSTRPAGFDEVVCRMIMRNARFEPALDVAGKPMQSYWRSSVRFEIPN